MLINKLLASTGNKNLKIDRMFIANSCNTIKKQRLMLKRISLIRFIVVCFSSVLFFGEAVAQSNFPTEWPDRIILNPSENPATSLAVSWRTDTTVHLGNCELQLATASRINPTDSKQFKAKTISMVFTNDAEPTIYSNHHTFTFTA